MTYKLNKQKINYFRKTLEIIIYMIYNRIMEDR